MKIDPYKNDVRWKSYKEKFGFGIPGLSKINSDLLINYLLDMEKGINISNVSIKGSRSCTRLNNLKCRISFLMKKLKERYNLDDIQKLKEDQLLDLFSAMRNGEIRTKDNRTYKSVQDYAKNFKAFWHWHQKSSKKQGKDIPDITLDLDTSGYKPDWVYLTEEQVKKLCENAKYEYKVLIMFLFDTGIRAPTELINIKISDLSNDSKELNIREEISKTFGRRIKLLLCSDLLKEYVKTNNLSLNDYLFPIDPYVVNRYLKRLGKKIFGDKESPAGQKYSDLTMYDFRHNSCCYWLIRYKSESALKYRFGWKKSDKIHYYSELLGMRDTISEEDLLIDVTKTEIENRLLIAERDKEIMQDRVDIMEKQLQKILELMKVADAKVEMIEVLR
ncbi:MAG: tyrosine-type recombinase/integrase [Nanoarchaeota archaeon]|nr:tyrosine-type recombinase/integrase [Nanoarchaeota archaeon]